MVGEIVRLSKIGAFARGKDRRLGNAIWRQIAERAERGIAAELRLHQFDADLCRFRTSRT